MRGACVAFVAFLLLCIVTPALVCSSRGCSLDACGSRDFNTAPPCDGASCTRRMSLAGLPRDKVVGDCPAGFAWMERPGAGVGDCMDCSLSAAVVGILLYPNQSQRCVHCGGDKRVPGLLDASYVAETKECVCPAGHELVEQVGEQVLEAQMCIPCLSDSCKDCVFPYTRGARGGCECVKGYTKLYDSSCVTTEEYERVSAAASGAGVTFRLLNLNNHGISGPPMTSVVAQNYSVGAAVQCARGQAVACNLLANLCVMMMYNTESLPCKLYLFLLSDNAIHSHLPQLYYKDESSLENALVRLDGIGAGDVIMFVASVYDWQGNWKGIRRPLEEFNLCRISDEALGSFFRASSNRKLRCFLDWDVFRRESESSIFLELFVADPLNASHLIPVPVVLDYTNDDVNPQGVRGSRRYHHSAASYRRRFYVYNDIGDSEMYPQEHTRGTRRHVTVLRHAAFVFDVSGGGGGGGPSSGRSVGIPLVVLQYASRILDVGADAAEPLQSLAPAVEGGLSVAFITDADAVNRGVLITMIVFTALCVFSAWIRTYGWMRRRQNMMMSVGAIIRFMVYLCNHVGNVYALIVTLTTWYIFAVYRSQVGGGNFFMSDRYVYLEAMLYTATVTKGIAVIYAILEQCNADYFVIDWERSKGQLLRENRILPVSMWRSTFVANELNELQVLRQWRPLLGMTIVLVLLLDWDFLGYATSAPTTPTMSDAEVYPITALRIALGTFLWFTVCLGLHIIEYQFFYRFIRVHPLQAFVDLCSVSNISIMILPEAQWGYYIHGESIHAHSDVSMEEFQQNLYLESQGNLPVRGLGGQSKCQTFEVFMGTYIRQYLYMCYAEIEMRPQRSLNKVKPLMPPGKRWHFMDCIRGFSRKVRVYDSETLAIKKQINSALQQSVRSAEGTLLIKFPLHRMLGMPPNILYMNGPQSGDKSGKDLFFVDEVLAYGKAFLYGIDQDLFVLYTMLYASVDAATHSVWAATLFTFVVETLIRWYRTCEGVANISTKTLIDGRFFL